MSERRAFGFIPLELSSELRMWAPEELSDDEMWTVTRMIERAFALGYDMGYSRGYHDGRDDHRRPSVNDIREIRERMQKEMKPDV